MGEKEVQEVEEQKGSERRLQNKGGKTCSG